MAPMIDYEGGLRHFHAALRIFVRQMNDMGGMLDCSISQPYTLDKMDNLPAHIVYVVFWLSDKQADRALYIDTSEYAPDRTKIYPRVSWFDNRDGKSWERNEPLWEQLRAFFIPSDNKVVVDQVIKTEEELNQAIEAIPDLLPKPKWWDEVGVLFFRHKKVDPKYTYAKLAKLILMETKHVGAMIRKYHVETRRNTPK